VPDTSLGDDNSQLSGSPSEQVSDTEKIVARTIGELPSPEVLAQYEALSPGFADKLIRIVEEEARHRRAFEEQRSRLDYRYAATGLILGSMVALATVIGAACLMLRGYEVSGVILASSTLVMAVLQFIGSYRKSRNGNTNEPDRIGGPL
jgi:uncharacterized membrane protein